MYLPLGTAGFSHDDPLVCHQLLEDEDSADEEFWNQDFFQEEKADEEYATESSEASEADSDFEESVRPSRPTQHTCSLTEAFTSKCRRKRGNF